MTTLNLPLLIGRVILGDFWLRRRRPVGMGVCMEYCGPTGDPTPSHAAVFRATISAMLSTSAYVANRNAPYLLPDVACSRGMNAVR